MCVHVEFPNAEGRLLRFAVDLTIVLCPFEGSGKGVLEPANVPGTFTGEKHDYKAYCAANTKKNKLFRYWLKVLSVQLVKRIGYTIHHRAMAMLLGDMNLRAAIRNGNAVALEMGRA